MNQVYKKKFTPDQGIYLLSHSVGRPPISALETYQNSFLAAWENAGENTWPQWIESINHFRSSLATLLNTQPDTICPQVNLSSGLTKILHSLPVNAERKTIVYSEHDFPSIAFVLQQAQRAGYQLRVIPAEMETLDPSVWAKHMDESVAIVLITQVQSNTGKQVPVDYIARHARDLGILSIVDVAQSIGCLPIDLQSWKADFVIGSCVKWLCGGPGAGFLWVAPERLSDCEPIDVGWFSHENPFEFDIYNFRYAKDALRFWGGTPSVQPYATAANSIQIQLEIGSDIIREHNVALTQRIIDAVHDDNLASPARAQDRSGTVILSFKDEEMEMICKQLREANILFDSRSFGIRLSPHIYNDTQEIETVIEHLQL